jgi:hypothetical protein
MENEIFLKVKEFLLKELGQSVIELPRIISKPNGDTRDFPGWSCIVSV